MLAARRLTWARVRWENGSVDSYPYIWLRDNCQCPKCYHPVSLARRVLLKDLDLSVNCVDIKLSNTGEEVEMLWTDGHQGTYDAHWLHERAFRGPKPAPHDREFRLKQQLWGREMQDKLPRISFPDIIHDDHSLLNFLESLEVMGVVLVSDVPCEIDQIYSFAKRIGHLRPTHYGETFNVYSRMDPNNLAYTGDSLDMHTDLPCLATKPEIQMLHVIKQFIGEGGDTMITDGFHAASKFKKNNPEYFDTLANTLIEFVDRGH
ncbi:Gamma-butyrobetaine dioxygenase [Portunus trituberculatus]|uniref:Gamma-butyrobetaine dioxygenase n=1 Tax=Portunus trituberculatus TaxID=210409 RepID=A0A5B7CZI5_PORTR|nr:Gamma-butyrobetaine dioxygenase [Portunus trituberculatus]